MNTPSNTPFACRIVRICSAVFHRTAPRHIDKCAACREFFGAAGELEQQLRRDAPREMQAVREGFDQRISLALRASVQVPRRSHTRVPTFAFAGAAAAIVFAVIFFYSGTERTGGKQHSVARSFSGSADMADLMATVDSLWAGLWNSFEPAATTLTRENPLSQELDLVQADARSALGFLALNFLPSGNPAPAVQPQRNLSPTRG